MALKADEARAIANKFEEAATAVDAYLDDQYRKIDRSEYEFLNESFKTLQRAATFLTGVAVDLTIAGLTDPVSDLTSIIERAKDKIKTLETVGRVISFVAGLTDLAASIMAKNPSAVVNSVTNLNKLLRG